MVTSKHDNEFSATVLNPRCLIPRRPFIAGGSKAETINDRALKDNVNSATCMNNSISFW